MARRKSDIDLLATAVMASDDASSDGPQRFAITAYTGEPMVLDGFARPVVVDLAGVSLASSRMPVLYDHVPSIDHVVGQADSVEVRDGRLLVEGRFVSGSELADRIRAMAASGYIWQASIGARVVEIESVDDGQTVEANGRQYVGPLELARRVQLREVSFVVLGADGRTAAIAARAKGGSGMSFEEWLVSLGFDDPAALTEIQMANLKLIFEEQYGEESAEDEAAPEEPMAQEPMEEKKEEEEAVPTNAAAVELPVRAADGAQKSRPPAKTLLDDIRASRRPAPYCYAPQPPRTDSTALEAALMLRCGVKLDGQWVQRADPTRIPRWMREPDSSSRKQQVMEAAYRLRNTSLLDMCRLALHAAGRSVPWDRHEVIQAAFSSGALTPIFTTNVNAMLLQAYLEAPDTTQPWTRTVEASDYKTMERVRLETGPGLKLRPRGMTAEHLSYDAQAETYKIHHYAAQFVVDEQDIIDDALGVFLDQPQRMGIAAARLRPDLVYSILLANPTLAATGAALFSTQHGNTVGSAALSASTLRAAVKTMLLFAENGVSLNITPRYVLVPPSLKHLAYELTNSSQILITGGSSLTERGATNALLADGLQPISEARLENGTIDPLTGSSHGGSATTWYLVSDMVPTIEVAYLSGTGRAPQIRSKVLDEGRYGIAWDVAMSIGAKALDWRGLLRNTAS